MKTLVAGTSLPSKSWRETVRNQDLKEMYQPSSQPSVVNARALAWDTSVSEWSVVFFLPVAAVLCLSLAATMGRKKKPTTSLACDLKTNDRMPRLEGERDVQK